MGQVMTNWVDNPCGASMTMGMGMYEVPIKI